MGRKKVWTDAQLKDRRAEYLAEWRKQFPDKRSEQRKREVYRLKIRAMLRISPELKCVRCAVRDVRVLEVNHKNGGGKKERDSRDKSKSVSIYGWIIYENRRTDDLEILCRPCNAVDHLERRFPDLFGKCRVRWV